MLVQIISYYLLNKKQHKVLTYAEYRAVSGVFQTIDPSPLSTQRVCPPPAPKAGGWGVHTRRAVGVGGGGSIFWKTPDIKLASYNIIPLREVGPAEGQLTAGAGSPVKRQPL
jgi:hypothetical protein